MVPSVSSTIVSNVTTASNGLLNAFISTLNIPDEKSAAFSPLNFLHCLVAALSAGKPETSGFEALRTACSLSNDFVKDADFGDVFDALNADPALEAAAALFVDPAFKVTGPGGLLSKKAAGALPKLLENVEVVNKFVDENTHGMIKRIIETLPDNVACVLVSVLYLKAAWAFPFERSNTHSHVFHGQKGDQNVSMMTLNQRRMGYHECPSFVSVSAPFKESGVMAYFVLPSEGVADNRSVLKCVRDAISATHPQREVILRAPRFQMDVTVDASACKALLTEAGAAPIYEHYDLSRTLSPEQRAAESYVSSVVHKVVVKVDEEGAEAAAATAMVMCTMCMPPPPTIVTCDRPFGFGLALNGIPLFVTAVQQPEQWSE